MKSAEKGDFTTQRDSELLDANDRFNEALITGLRRVEGVDPKALLKHTGLDIQSQSKLAALLADGRCEWVNGRLRIPEAHWPLADAITLELIK